MRSHSQPPRVNVMWLCTKTKVCHRLVHAPASRRSELTLSLDHSCETVFGHSASENVHKITTFFRVFLFTRMSSTPRQMCSYDMETVHVFSPVFRSFIDTKYSFFSRSRPVPSPFFYSTFRFEMSLWSGGSTGLREKRLLCCSRHKDVSWRRLSRPEVEPKIQAAVFEMHHPVTLFGTMLEMGSESHIVQSVSILKSSSRAMNRLPRAKGKRFHMGPTS